MSSKFIFISGGVVSALGKGICSASIGALLESAGFSVKIKKLDPYLNIDSGTMNPIQHGEVFVTDDGIEADLDLGHYERFTSITTGETNSITSGKIYAKLLEKERRGDYLGKTVQVIPHVTDLIKEFIYDHDNEDFIISEIGGTVGDIESLPFFEAIRQIKYELTSKRSMNIHLTLVPYLRSSKSLKTKPTQHSVKELGTFGISADLLICRSEHRLSDEARDKIASFCNVKKENVIPGYDVDNIYKVPIEYHKHELDKRIIEHFGLEKQEFELTKWQELITKNAAQKDSSIRIAIICKYQDAEESYKSLLEALKHAALENNTAINIKYISAQELDLGNVESELACVHAILVPGGFGLSGIDGKMLAIRYARTFKIPFLGICLGMQLSVIEYARNVLGLDAWSSEIDNKRDINSGHMLVGLVNDISKTNHQSISFNKGDLGGTMRLGSYCAKLSANSLAHKIYKNESINERHRHRYEVNIKYKDELEKQGLLISGLSEDGLLPEIVELKDHPFFIAVQYHPEFKTKVFQPHPLFQDFISHAVAREKECEELGHYHDETAYGEYMNAMRKKEGWHELSKFRE